MLNYHNKKFFHVFTAGQYPQGTVTAMELEQIAQSYDPTVYEAPIWIGHPSSSSSEEPKAYGWVEALMVIGDKLYASFSHLDDDLIKMVNSKKYRRCSIELGKLNYEPFKDCLYLVAVALTNRPAVAGLPALEFAERDRNYNPELVAGKILYSMSRKEIKSGNNLNKNNKMEKILEFALGVGVELDQGITEEKLAKKLHSVYTQLQNEVKIYKTKATDILLKSAIAQAKIVPAQEGEIREFAEENLDACMKFIDKLPPKALFTRSIESTGFAGHDNQKFTKSDGSPLTYNDVLNNPGKYSKILTEEELIKLREESNDFGNF